MNYICFLLQQPVSSDTSVISGTYDLRLMLVAYLIAVLAAYTTLELGGRVAMTRGRARQVWLVCGALALGTGIWSMHFTGMLSFSLDMPMTYDVPLVLLSLLVAIGASGAGLFMIRHQNMRPRRIFASGSTMGMGIAAMHYIGMAAMRMSATVHYQPLLVGVSVCIAIGASIVALWLAILFRQAQRRTKMWVWLKLASALVMALAIVGLHYTGMFATSFSASLTSVPSGLLQIEAIKLASTIGLMTTFILGLALISTFIDRRFSAQVAAFKSLFLHHPDAVYELDLAGAIQSANPAAAAALGCGVDVLLDTHFMMFVVAEDVQRIQHYFQQVVDGHPQQYEITMHHQPDQRVLLTVTNVPIYINDQVVGMYMFAKDITAQRRAEAERTRLITILETTTDIIGTTDPAGKIVYCNHSGRKMFGWEPEGDLSAHTFGNYYAPDTQKHMLETAIPAAIRDTVWSGEGAILDHTGKEILVSQVIIAHKHNDNSLAFLSTIVRDITERKRVEQALQAEQALLEERIAERTADLSAANKALARAARMKDEFLANMSHELRTPLNAILGLSEALQEGIYRSLNPEQAKAVRAVEESGRHLLALINDILDLSKIEAGKLVLNLDVVYIEEIGETSLRMIRQTAQQKQITVSATFDSIIPVIWADARRLKQILVNLLSNAVKFTPNGGSIGLDIASDPENQRVFCTVWDTGIGIDTTDVQRLFKPFVQLDSSRTRQYEGTGLGLALVQRMVELHSGRISVESVLERGSRFTVSLPSQMPEEANELINALARHGQHFSNITLGNSPSAIAQHSIPQQQSIIAAAPLILLAEDNAANITTFVDYLEMKGYKVIVARNGRDTLAYAAEAHPNLILLDIQMPTMDGMEVICSIRANTLLAHTPIIALTALAMEADRKRCLELGANVYLSKPVSLQCLTETIEKQLRLTAQQ